MNNSGPLKALGAIGAMNTFIENFPMNILDLSYGPTYTSIFEFIIDVLQECNVPIRDIMNRLIERVFEISQDIEDDGDPATIADAIENMKFNEQSAFLKILEDGTKGIVMALLTSIFSCSAIPVIPSRHMDAGKDDKGDDRIRNILDQYQDVDYPDTDTEIKIPYGVLNMFGHLNVSPFSNEGKMFFAVDGRDRYYKKVEIAGAQDTPPTYEYQEIDKKPENAERKNSLVADENSPEYIVCYQGLDPNTLYRTMDMNAFMWYVYNRSCTLPQAEVNKSMWDSRRTAKMSEKETRVDSAKWNEWINSKSGSKSEFTAATSTIYPILQFRKIEGGLGVRFPAQRYFKPNATADDTDAVFYGLRSNATIYQFNWEYLQSIQIFNPKVILYGMYDALLNGLISAVLSIRFNVYRKETDTILSNAIKKYIEAEDSEVEDCYFKFSNEEFDNMLRDMLLSRYNAVYNGGEVNVAAQKDVMDYINQIDSVDFSATAAGDTAKITKIVTDVVATDKVEGSIEYGIDVSMDDGWWKKLIWAIALPIVKSIFTPQIILLFLINFHIMGVTSLEDLFGGNQSAIIKLLTNKIFGLVRSIISFLKDKIVEILFELFEEKILPLILKYQLIKFKEKIEAWIELLYAALLCLPRFRFSSPVGSIDDVKYADIVYNEQDKPESSEGC